MSRAQVSNYTRWVRHHGLRTVHISRRAHAELRRAGKRGGCRVDEVIDALLANLTDTQRATLHLLALQHSRDSALQALSR